MNSSTEIRLLVPSDAAAFQALRLDALLDAPGAFSSSHAEEVELPIERVAARLSAESNSCAFGAFHAGQLIGMAGLYRETKQKLRHKVSMWGVFVAPRHRGTGLGRALVTAAVEHAARMPGVEQINISVFSGNAPARRIYLSCGFLPFGQERRAALVDGVYLDEEYMARFVREE